MAEMSPLRRRMIEDMTVRNLSPATQRSYLYAVTLGQAEIPERIAYAREPRKLPVVLNADEVVRFLEAVASLKTRTALTTAYAAGLRASETVGLKLADIDSGRPDGDPG